MLKVSKQDLRIDSIIIKNLREFLIFEEYDEIYKTLRGVQYHIDPWWNLDGFERTLWSLPRKKQLMYHLFFLGKSVPYPKVVYFIDKDLIDGLIKLNLFCVDKNIISSNGFSVVPYRHRFFLVDLCYTSPNAVRRAPEAYLGADSYICANYHIESTSKDSILDLCCGPGFQMILALKNAKSCLGIEISPFAERICKFNLILNQVQDRIEVRCGNLYKPIKEKKFSIIYANPPFIPVPRGIDYPIPGNGGEDGIEILKQIYDKMDFYLLEQGRSIVYCEALGDNNTIFFLDWLRKISQKNKWKVEIFILGKVYHLEQIRRAVKLMTKTYDNLKKEEEFADRWLRFYSNRKTEIKYLYSLVIKIYKGISHKSDFLINNFSNPFTPEDIFLLNRYIKVNKSKDMYDIFKHNHIIANTDKIGKFLIEKGPELSIKDIAKAYYEAEKRLLTREEKNKKFIEGIVIDTLLNKVFEFLKLGIIYKR